MAAKILSRVSRNWGFGVSEGITRVRVFSTGKAQDSIFKRISPLGDPGTSVVPLLEEWVREGRKVHKSDLQSLVKEMRRYRRYKHALEICRWMSDRRYHYLSPSDHAIRLDLISKVHGLEQAEQYFGNITKQAKTFETYGALLNCYAQERSVEKAESIAEKMKELGFFNSALSYNALMTLYTQTGEVDKLDILIKEMEEKAIRPDNFTNNIRMKAYAKALDIERMDKFLQTLEHDPLVTLHWNIYTMAANAYIRAGLIDNAMAMLKKVEALCGGKHQLVYDCLLTLYASVGQKAEVQRIWGHIKTPFNKPLNSSYRCFISSLLKLGDVEEADKVFREWDSHHEIYDFRVLNVLLYFYCNNGFLEKAEEIIKIALERQKVLTFNTWEILAGGYLKNNQISMAVDAMKKALSLHQGRRRLPDSGNVAAGLEFFRQNSDVEGIEEFISLLRPVVPLTREVYHELLRTYISAGRPVETVIERMKGENIEPDEETEVILKGDMAQAFSE